MVRYIWLLILLGLVYWIIRELFRTGHRPNKTGGEGEEMVRDSTCGVYLPESKAISLRRSGTNHYFCSEECREKFRESTK
jgi:YHS domain-containing protein